MVSNADEDGGSKTVQPTILKMKITVQELQCEIRRGPAAVIGPDITTSGAREFECLKMLKERFPGFDDNLETESYLEYADLILASGAVAPIEVREQIESHFKNPTFINPNLSTIVRPNWTAIISLTADDFLKAQLSDFLQRAPTAWMPVTVAEPALTLPLTTIPYYALMGDIRDKREIAALAISASGLLRRERHWHQMLSTLPSVLKGDPLVFLGTGSIVDRTCRFFNELLKLQPQIPKRIIFLDNDPTPRSAVFRNLVGSLCEIQIADCTLTELANSLSRANLEGRQLPLFIEHTKALVDPKVFVDIEDQAVYVPRREEIKVDPAEHHRLLDLLFRPTHLDWSPYAINLHFRREICGAILDHVRGLFALGGNKSKVVQIKGEAGIGKTVIGRTLAFELAQENRLCIWLRRSYGEVSGSRFETVVKKLTIAVLRPETEVVFFLDDPTGSRMSLSEIIAALARAQFRWVVVVISRKSDQGFITREGVVVTVPEEDCFQIQNDFTSRELELLPQYLVAIGVAATISAAGEMMVPPGVKHSKDVLCSLWYLLPQTHGAIEDSLISEYRRLGDIEDYVQKYASAASDGKKITKTAYELVTATSGFDGIPLPVEVLVGALGISYAEWNDQCKEQKPLWGLLYDESYPSAETYAYRTRNHIVTQVLLRVLNDGSAGHTGEFRCLKKLIAACTSTSPQYKTFLEDVLVSRRVMIEKRFNYVQAMELYEVALKVYPKSWGVIEHQKAIVKRHLGGDAQEAYDELKKLIARTSNHAIADQDSADNLHTSAAAALNQLIKEERTDPVTAAETVFEHVTVALTIDQFSLHSHHVHAHTLLNIASRLRNTNHLAFMSNVERAGRITGRAILLISQAARAGKASQSTANSLKMFEELKEEILLTHSDLRIAELQAKESFQKNADQTGFAFLARVMLTRAVHEGKGRLFKKLDDYLRECFQLINLRQIIPIDELFLCRIELIINWNLNDSKGPVFWEQFRDDLVLILGKARYGADVMWHFYLGVTEYNLGHFPEAEMRFQRLRSQNIPWEAKHIIRCFYLGDKSIPKIFEGKISEGSGRNRFIYSSELGTDVLVERDDFRERQNEVKHFKVGFSFYGPIAVERT